MKVLFSYLRKDPTVKKRYNHDTSVEAKTEKKIRNIAIKALKNISLANEAHEEIFRTDNLAVLVRYLFKIEDLYLDPTKQIMLSRTDDEDKDKAKDELMDQKDKKLKNAIKTLTNCLMNQKICRRLDKSEAVDVHAQQILEFFHKYHQASKVDSLRNVPKQVKSFFIEIQSECTLALSLIERSSAKFVTNQSDKSKASYMLSLLKSNADTH